MPSCSRDEPSAPHSLGDLSIDDAQRRVTLAQFLGAIDRVCDLTPKLVSLPSVTSIQSR